MTDSTRAAAAERAAYLRLAGVTLFWGGTYVVTRLAVHEVPPATVAALRLAISSALFMAVAPIGRRTQTPAGERWERTKGLWRRHGWLLILLGTFGMGYYMALLNYGIREVGAAQAGLLAPSAFPVMIAVLARLLMDERLSTGKVLGLLLAAAGMALVVAAGVRGGLPWRPLGYAALAVAAVGFSLYSVYGPRLLRELDPLTANTWIGLIGALGLLPWVLAERPLEALATAGPRFWLALAYLSVLGQAVSYAWWYHGIAVLGASRTGAFTYIVPVWAVTLATLFLGEPITAGQVVGGALALGGVALVNGWQPGRSAGGRGPGAVSPSHHPHG